MNSFKRPTENIGLYIHVPFCKSKCPYCNFYSLCNNNIADEYTKSVLSSLESYGKKLNRTADTLYIGGGTPPLLGEDNLSKIVAGAKKHFNLTKDAEITCEVNPTSADKDFFEKLFKAGVNRISIGVQSGIDDELVALGRKHTTKQVVETVSIAKEVEFTNISLDLMLGIPNQTIESLQKSIEFLVSLNPTHISAYLLKIEPDTYFGKNMPQNLPDEELCADLYEKAVEILSEKGYYQYETSNFAKFGFESRHNLKYWHCEEYLGIGPSAHSFIDGERFFYPSNITDFISGNSPVLDGDGGDFEEYAMLTLRLAEGLIFKNVKYRFNIDIPQKMIDNAKILSKIGLVILDDIGIRLTPKGQLLSNAVIGKLLDL
ncbi:MAG: radical SAM family heme chaperone HemW [Clostridia bacterium]|nr:radical SAM family heme chaperone HemW [Clostridia bacterium]